MDDISTRNIALSRKELYILIFAVEKDLKDDSERVFDTEKLLKRLEVLLGE